MGLFHSAIPRLLKQIVIIIFSVLFVPFFSFAEDEHFPLYPEIRDNVIFWQNVYSRYTTTQGILHDDEDLSLIYEVIPLEPRSAKNHRKINKKRIDDAKKKYRVILDLLSTNPDTLNFEQKRIAALFEPNAEATTYKRAAKRIRCQIGQKNRFLEGLKRSGGYLSQIQKIFESYNLPTDLAFLPHVESSFDTEAYSKFGAAGIWQFTLGTGKRFLKIGYALDERRDPIASSHAAASLLKKNYEELNSWPLAITAYNHGAAGMKRAQKQWESYPRIISNFRSRTFKFASRNFYSEFLAAKNVAHSYKEYFGEVHFDSPHKTQSIVLEGYAALKDIIEVFDVDVSVLAQLNPALRPPVFKGRKYLPQGYRLHLPETATIGKTNIASVFPRSRYHQEQKPSHFYAVQRGDTAGKIARMHKVRLSDLLLANNLDKNATIYINQNLRIPIPEKHPSALVASDQSQTIEPLEIPNVPQPMLASILPTSFNESESSQTQNPIAIDTAAVQPTFKASINPEIISGNLKIEKVWTEKEKIFGLLKVEVEETLGHYADWLEIKTQVLRNLNGLRYGRFVHIGQPLKIPLDRVSRETFEEKRFDYHKRLQEDFFSAYRIEELQPYYVRRGENIWMLSNEKFNLPIWLIQQCNPAINFHDLRHSQKIMLPLVEYRKG